MYQNKYNIKEKEEYLFKKDFCKELNITQHQLNHRFNDLCKWLTNFYDYELKTDTKPYKIYIKEVLGEYKPLPRKSPKQDELTRQKMEDYEIFTIASLNPTEFVPNSMTKIAREAIDEFGYNKYGHYSSRSVAQRYIKEPFKKHAETNDHYVWVYFSTYEPLDEEVLSDWIHILSEEHISEAEAANAFYRGAEGEDISKEISYYKKAKERFINKYNDIPIRVREWKLLTSARSCWSNRDS